MTPRLIELAGCPAQPWRNGAGRTHELLAWPAGEDWTVRVSLAEIEREAPFSAFPGVERWFAVVEGAGVRLDFAGRPLEVTTATRPLRFAGEAAPGCTLIAGPTRDLNLMVRRSRGRGWMCRARPGAAPPAMTVMGLYAADAVRCHFADGDGDADGGGDRGHGDGDGVALDVPAHTLAWFGQARRVGLLCGGPRARAWWLGFEPGFEPDTAAHPA